MEKGSKRKRERVKEREKEREIVKCEKGYRKIKK